VVVNGSQEVPAAVREYLHALIEQRTGITPGSIRFVWTGPGRGVVSFDDGTPHDGGTLEVTGVEADMVRELELGPDPIRLLREQLFGTSGMDA
jgi:hypothetical protein